jgi:hypothetical protein
VKLLPLLARIVVSLFIERQLAVRKGEAHRSDGEKIVRFESYRGYIAR